MVVVEEQHGQETKRHGNKHPLDIEIPEVDKPVSGLCGMERCLYGNSHNVCVLQRSWNVGESDPENRSKLWEWKLGNHSIMEKTI